MRKILFSAFLAVMPFLGQGQIFQEDFDGNGPGIGAWTLINDTNTPNAAVSFISNAWNSIDRQGANGNYGGPAGNFAAMSTSWFTAVAPADRWLITPSIVLPASAAQLKWDAKAQDPLFPDGYKVMLSTNGGNTKADFDKTLFSTTGEDSDWITRTVSLAPYAGTTVRIAFVENSTDMFMILVDNVKVELAPATPPNCATLTSPANGATGIAYFTTSLSWMAPTTGPIPDSYDVYLDTNANPTTLVNNTTGLTYAASNLNPNTTYYWKVISKNATGDATGCQVYSFTTMPPTYCQAGATSTSFEKISNVTFSDINNSSTSTAGYEDFTSVVGNVSLGQTYTFTANFSGTSFSDDQVIVWIDFNQDKTFDPSEQVLITTPHKAPWTGSITIPNTALTGTTRMRVRLHDSVLTPNTTPCGTSSFGQVEDYTLNISTLAVTDVNKLAVKTYPNPVKDIFHIEAGNKVKTVYIYDASGKQVLVKDLNAAKSELNLSKLTKGIYVVRMVLEDGNTSSTKIVKE